MKCQCGAEMVKRSGRYGEFWGCSTYPQCKRTKPYNGEVQAEEKDFEPSRYQRAAFEFVEKDEGHGVIDAKAGSGKTTTIVKALHYTSPKATVAFVAFNKRIVDTLSSKAPPHVYVATTHSLGLGNARNALGNVKVEPDKVRYIVKDLQDQMDWERADVVGLNFGAILRLVSLCKATLHEPTDENLEELSDRYGVDTNGDAETIFAVVKDAYRLSIEQEHAVDFDDMIWLSATGRVPCRTFDWVFVDETQDLNAAQLAMILRSVKPGGRILAVGDPNQSIYGFRGADTEAMPRIIDALDATVLPLSITYRCPKSHVALANTLVPELEAAEWAEDGILDSVSEYQMLERVRSGDLVLCRINAPLARHAFNLIRQGRKAVVLGRDIGAGLMAMVAKVQKRYEVRSLDDTLDALVEYRAKETARLMKAGKDMQADALDDRVETVFALADGCYTMRELEDKVETIFSDKEEGVVFSTVHKAKGSEADNVYILHPELMPHPKASQGWELEQEFNIQYVAWTRAKKELHFVGAAPAFQTEGMPLDEQKAVDDAVELMEEDKEFHRELDAMIAEERALTSDQEELIKEMYRLQPFTKEQYNKLAREARYADKFTWEDFDVEFAEREREQEERAFLSDPDYRAATAKAMIDAVDGPKKRWLTLNWPGDIGSMFPAEGRFEDNIYRPSAHELVGALPEFDKASIDNGQLVLALTIKPGYEVLCYTSIKVGEIAGGTGDDSIRVFRRDKTKAGTFYYKDEQDWITRRVPKNVDTPEQAVAHIAVRILEKARALWRDNPLQVKCRSRDGGIFWKTIR